MNHSHVFRSHLDQKNVHNYYVVDANQFPPSLGCFRFTSGEADVTCAKDR